MSNVVAQKAGWLELMGTKDLQSEIQDRAIKVMKSLQTIFESDDFSRSVDLAFSIAEEVPISATFLSPLGTGRLRYEWGVNADGLVGIVVVEGVKRDKYDTPYFEAVMRLVFPPYDEPYYVARGERHVLKLRSYSDDRRQSILALGMSMLRASMTEVD